MSLLKIHHLQVSFRRDNIKGMTQDIVGVKDISLEVHKGEVIALVGASGSGKSLLAHAIFGLLPYNAQQKGHIYFKDCPLEEKDLENLRGKELALIPQSVIYLDPLMKIGKQVLGPKGDPTKMKEILKNMNLDKSVEDLYPFQLSGGMARRILVSTALMSEAECIIADEPTPGMDAESAIKALNCLRQMAENDKGVILITHDIDLALGIADRIVVLYEGTIVDDVPVKAFTVSGNGLSHPYTKALFQSLPQNSFSYFTPKEVAQRVHQGHGYDPSTLPALEGGHPYD